MNVRGERCGVREKRSQMRMHGAEKRQWLVVKVEVGAEPQLGTSRSGNSGLVSTSTGRYLKLLMHTESRLHLLEVREHTRRRGFLSGTTVYNQSLPSPRRSLETRARDPRFPTRLSTVRPRERPMADYAAKLTDASDGLLRFLNSL